MTIQIKIEHNLTHMLHTLDKIKQRAAKIAVRQALNKTIMSTRTKSNQAFRQERNLKLGDLNRKYTSLKRATGMNINQMEAQIKISGESISLIRFVKGSKLPRSQKGISVRKRKALRFEVKPSLIRARQKLFIARGKSNNVHVFLRAGNKIIKQNAPGLAQVFGRDAINQPITMFAKKDFKREFSQAFRHQLSLIMGR